MFQLMENTFFQDRAPFTSGYRVDLLDLVLCAVGLGLALWARGQYLKATGTPACRATSSCCGWVCWCWGR
ncbi:hypothetical protein [Deinococcus multiflagellatus]|uniref:Prolipoprotein signal peptidase n=1 Tax=Deinococcus multiflagellatus TaxID=1656887 RepID=A0ABW1ZM97_9DEIO